MAYSNTVSFQAPTDFLAEQQANERQRALYQAQLLRSMQSSGPSGGMVGNFYVPPSWTQQLASALQGPMAKSRLDQADAKSKDIYSRERQAYGEEFSKFGQLLGGTPAQTEQPLTPNDDEGNPMPPATTAAVPGNRQQALAFALGAQNPMLQQMAIQQMAKENEPFTLKPGETRFSGGQQQVSLPSKPGYMNVNGQIVRTTDDGATPVGAPIPKQLEPDSVVTHGPDGSLVPNTPVIAAKQSVEQPSRDVTIRGQNMTDARQREMNGILANGQPNPSIETTARAIANNQLPALSGFAMKTPWGQAVTARVMEINPNYNAADFASGKKAAMDFTTGKTGNAVRSFNVALSHLDTLDKLSDALNNGNLTLVNKISNEFSQQTGAPPVTDFNAAKKIVSDEIVKAIVGSGGGVADREEAARTISAANSPAQLRGVIATYKELMRGQLGGLRKQYESTTGKNDFDKFLSDQAKAESGGAVAPAGAKFLGFE